MTRSSRTRPAVSCGPRSDARRQAAWQKPSLARATALALLATVTSLTPALAGDWARFLGPAGSSISEDSDQVSEKWGDEENIKWKADLPGPGVSSPIVVGDRVFVTSYSGYGTGGDDESIEDLKRHVTCIDAVSGKQLWSKTIDAVQPEDPYRPPGVTAHGYASNTPASDGKHVFAFLGKSGVIAFDLDGNEIWRKSVGTGSGPQRWGSASSPILHDAGDSSLLIVTASEESESIFAFDTETGKEVWKTKAPDLRGTWSTPNLVKTGDRTDLVISVPGEVWGMNPETGKLRWYSRGTTDNSTAASPIVIDDLVIAVGGRSGEAVAVRAGGKGDVNDSHVVWDANIPGRFASPIAHDGHLYIYSSGILNCYDAKTGDRVGQKRLSQNRDSGERTRGGGPGGPGGPGGGRSRGGGGGGREYATPVLVDGKLFVTGTGGEFYVVNATPEMEVIQTNKLSDSSGFAASPAVSKGRLLLRSGKHLYCVAQ